MSFENEVFPFRSRFSLAPLLDFWRDEIATKCTHLGGMFAGFEAELEQYPELKGPIEDPAQLEPIREIFTPLMAVIFPAASWETDIATIMIPHVARPVYYTPTYERLFLDDKGRIRGKFAGASEQFGQLRHIGAYHTVLREFYDLYVDLKVPLVVGIPDPVTELDRYYRINPDENFIRVEAKGDYSPLSDEERNRIREDPMNLDLLAELVPSENFEFSGFAVVRATEITEAEIISQLEKDLISEESIFSSDGFMNLLDRIRVLFGQPDLIGGLAAVLEKEDKVLLISPDCVEDVPCNNPMGCSQITAEIDFNPDEIPLAASEETIFRRVYETGRIEWIEDLAAETDLPPLEQAHLDHGIRSMMVVPLEYDGQPIGTMDLSSPRPGALGPAHMVTARQIAPLFSMALKRGLNERESMVQAVIKERCTAIHPAVEWRFRRAARAHLDLDRSGRSNGMEEIVFPEVIPLYGQCDIRGSSELRNKYIQADISRQLDLAREVIRWAVEAKPWPYLEELDFRLERRTRSLKEGLSTGDEESLLFFVQTEVEPTFTQLEGLGPRVMKAIQSYHQALDPKLGMVYQKRQAFEESVSRLNRRYSALIDQAEAEAQALFGHYFEKRQTDGLDYMIYVGRSLLESGEFSDFHLRNLTLWQLQLACRLAWETERLKSELPVPLEACNLILLNQSPLSIRFRYDEKRFDVDGAYDVRHEIIKSRIDKATIKSTGERLTQPGKIAIVYSTPREENAARRHVEYLQLQSSLTPGLEYLELDDLPGVRGLNAIRAEVNLEYVAAGAEDQVIGNVG